MNQDIIRHSASPIKGLSPNLSPKSFFKPTGRKLLTNIINPIFQQELKSRANDNLLNTNPLMHPLVQSTKSQQYTDSFSHYLNGNFSAQELVFSKNFPKLLSRINDTSIKNKFVKFSVRRNTHSPDPSARKPSIVQVRKEENQFDKYFIQKGSDESKRKIRFIDLKWQLREARNKKNAKERALARWEKLKDIINENIQLRRKLRVLQKKNGKQAFTAQQKLLTAFQGIKEEEPEQEGPNQESTYRKYKLKDMIVLAQPPLNNIQMHEKAQLKYLSTTARHRKVLMNLFFRTNADQFINVTRDPFPASYRRLLMKSDTEYAKVLQTYLRKVPLYEEWKLEQDQRRKIHWQTNSSITTLTQRKPMDRAPDPLVLSRQISQQERLYMDRIADLEHYDQKFMQKTLVNDRFIQKRSFHKQSSKRLQTIKHNRIYSNQLNSVDFSDNSSNASITEAALDILYDQTKNLKGKLNNPETEDQQLLAMRRIKALLKLDNIQRQIHKANSIKLKTK